MPNLKSHSISLPAPVSALLQRLQGAGHQAYVVGGGVRDALLGRPVKEWDVCTSATPTQVSQIFPRVIPTGLKHGTVTVLIDSGPVEVTTLRLEDGYADGRHPDKVVFTDDLSLDLARRDFTVNAMAWDEKTSILHDPFEGRTDLTKKRLRTVGEAVKRLSEDGLRAMRAVRFAAQLEFTVDAEVLQAIRQVLPVVRKVAVERLRDEFMKLLSARRPSIGLRLMKETGLMEIVMPELLEGVGVEQNEYHAYDVFDHSLQACDAAQDEPRLRLAVLLHDIGKPRTRKYLKGAYRFYGHDAVGAKMVDRMLERLRFSNDDRKHVVSLVEHHMFYYREEWTDAAVRRFVRKIGEDNIDDLLALRVADEIGSGVNAPDYPRLEKLRSRLAQVKAQQAAISTRQLAINGNDIMREFGLKPGPMIGRILGDLLEKVLEDPSLNEREKLLAQARQLI